MLLSYVFVKKHSVIYHKSRIRLVKTPFYFYLQVQLQHENYATEDVFLFGYIRKSIEIEPLYLNPRFTYDKFSITRWLKSTTNDQHPFPYIFAAMNTSTEDYLTLSKNLWEKTSSIHIYWFLENNFLKCFILLCLKYFLYHYYIEDYFFHVLSCFVVSGNSGK